MKYSVTLFKVKSEQNLILSFKKIGKLPAATMTYNVVILKSGTYMQAFGVVVIPESEHGYTFVTDESWFANIWPMCFAVSTEQPVNEIYTKLIWQCQNMTEGCRKKEYFWHKQNYYMSIFILNR